MPKVKINVAADKNEGSQKKKTKNLSPSRRSRVSKTRKTKTTSSSSSNRISKVSSQTRTNKRKAVSQRKVTALDEKKTDKKIQPEKKSTNRIKAKVEQKVRVSTEENKGDDLKLEDNIKKSEKPTKKSEKTISLEKNKSNDVENLMSTMEQKKKEKEKVTPTVELTEAPQRRIKLYRSIALTFIFFTFLLLVTVFYFSVVKMTIILVPDQKRISNNMIFDVYDKERVSSGNANGLGGVVNFLDLTYKKTYPATGEEIIGQEVVGEVIIINNYTKNQPLVATTRLLSPDGKLYRLKKTVNVPAGGTVKVAVYADEPKEEMAIGPTKFTIPGLWAGLQDKIYAESKGKFVYQKKIKKHIKQEDIDNALRDLKQELLLKAKSDVNEVYKDYSQVIYKIDDNSIETKINGKVGDEVDNFLVEIKAKVMVVAFSGEEAAKLAKQKFIASLPPNKEMISFDKNNIIYSLNNFDYDGGTATINATFEGRVTLREGASIIDIDKILGLNQKQLDAYLSSLPEISGFEVKFYPSFIKKVPRLKDRIKVEVKK